MSLSPSIGRGILSLPGASQTSKVVAERLLKKDLADHHCFFNPRGFHNHLSHHILAAYDLGAQAPLLQAIYDDVAKIQRPIDMNENGVVPEGIVKPGLIKEDNWTKWLGDQKAYQAYVTFFSDRIAAHGIVKTVEDYIFSPAANGNGASMLNRLFSGVIHPFIQLGYALEFSSEVEAANGLSQAAVHGSQDIYFISPKDFKDAAQDVAPTDGKRRPRRGPSILSLLREIYDSQKLIPILPYDPDTLLNRRTADLLTRDGGSRIAELHRILSHFDPGETQEDFIGRVEELVFASTLLAFGTGKRNRKPRVDFFLMHLLTSTLFVRSYLEHLTKVEYKKSFLRVLLQAWGLTLMVRGRPRIDPELLMSYTDVPAPPGVSYTNVHSSAIDGKDPKGVNPWPAIIADVLHAPDSHTIKSIRTLLYGAIHYGTLPKGQVIGAFDESGKETHAGIAEVDGTVFARAAGILMDRLGWVTHGQEDGEWDRSGLGWDDAWKNED